VDNDCNGEVDDGSVCGFGIGDHFMAYKVKKSPTDATEVRTLAAVSLVDPTWGESASYTFKKERALLLPANKSGEGIADPNTHLLSYQIRVAKGDLRHAKRVGVKVVNQFHPDTSPLSLDTNKADRLLVPTLKDLQNPVGGPPDPNSHDVDHYKCYRVKASGFALIPGVRATDQFEDRLYHLKKPRRLCNAVDKNGEGIKSPDAHLLCYQVKRVSGQLKHTRLSGIHVNTQFAAPLQLDSKKEDELCVPTEIVDPGVQR
jgi:hypothetical protein